MELELKLEGRLSAFVAITVVVLSVFMAIAHLKDENVIQTMQHVQVKAVDSWNEYQATRLKSHMDENSLTALKIESGVAGVDAKASSSAMKRFTDRLGHYKTEASSLSQQATAYDQAYDDLYFRHEQFDMTDALCSIALALAAVAALSEQVLLLLGAWVSGGFGVIMGVAAMVGWNLHPEWLARLL